MADAAEIDMKDVGILSSRILKRKDEYSDVSIKKKVKCCYYELSEPSLLSVIVIKHNPEKSTPKTRTFTLQGQMNSNTWNLILSGDLQDNCSLKTYKVNTYCQKLSLCIPYSILKFTLTNAADTSNLDNIELLFLGQRRSQLNYDPLDQFRSAIERHVISLIFDFASRRDSDLIRSLLTREQNAEKLSISRKLLESFIHKGDFELSERLLKEALYTGKFRAWASTQKYVAYWKEIHTDINPGPLKCHQMAYDSKSQSIYLYGGFNQKMEENNELWQYSIPNKQWKLYTTASSSKYHPKPLITHQLVADELSRRLWLVGYAKPKTGGNSSQLYLYSFALTTKVWDFVKVYSLSSELKSTYYQNIVLDTSRRQLHVFGEVYNNNLLDVNDRHLTYDIDGDLWENREPMMIGQKTELENPMKRTGKIGVYHKGSDGIYLFGGKNPNRNNDFCTFNYALASNILEIVGYFPPCEFNLVGHQCCLMKESVLISHGVKVREGINERTSEDLLLYDINTRRMSVLKQKGTSKPNARQNHQLVYDAVNDRCYLYGGTSDVNSNAITLQDFWQLDLKRNTELTAYYKCLYLLRKQQFIEFCHFGKYQEALLVLQQRLNSISLEANEQKILDIQEALTQENFAKIHDQNYRTDILQERFQVFDAIIAFLPKEEGMQGDALFNMVMSTLSNQESLISQL